MSRKSILFLLCIGFLNFLCVKQTIAQPDYLFQSINKHTLYFSFSWSKKINLGLGYSYRTSSTQFAEISAEWRSPIDEFFNGDNFEVIVGPHFRHTAKRSVVASASHVRFQKITEDNRESLKLGLALSFIPGYQYAASLNDGPSSVLGARLTYNPTIVSWTKDESTDEARKTEIFKRHSVELGVHWDMMVKRSLALSVHPYVVNTWSSEESATPEAEDWDIEGEFYFGASYWLER